MCRLVIVGPTAVLGVKVLALVEGVVERFPDTVHQTLIEAELPLSFKSRKLLRLVALLHAVQVALGRLKPIGRLVWEGDDEYGFPLRGLVAVGYSSGGPGVWVATATD